MKVLKSVRMFTAPNMGNDRCKPFLEIITLKNFEILYSGKESKHIKKYKAIVKEKDFQPECPPCLPSDEFIELEDDDVNMFNTTRP